MRIYNFWFTNSKHESMKRFDRSNPLSSTKGNLKDADNWAKHLLKINWDENQVEYMAEHGRKIYILHKWFDKFGNMLGEIPQECINACSHTGDCTNDIQYWIKYLVFSVPVDLARKYLRDFGTWEDLDTCSQDLLNERVLWIACGDLKEFGKWFGLGDH